MQGGRSRRAAGLLNDPKWAAARHCRRTATGLVLNFRIGVQVRSAIDDLHVLEARFQQFLPVGLDA